MKLLLQAAYSKHSWLYAGVEPSSSSPPASCTCFFLRPLSSSSSASSSSLSSPLHPLLSNTRISSQFASSINTPARSSRIPLTPLLLLHLRAPQCTTPHSNSVAGGEEDPIAAPGSTSWVDFLAVATSLYPLYMLLGGLLAFLRPSAFTWFVRRGPASYSFSLAAIMLATGLSLRLEELTDVILKRPFQLLFGCFSQYTLMPILGAAISKVLQLPMELSAGLILVACCPGGTASNVVTYIARGDVPLSVVMTVCTTFAAVCATPLLTQLLAGAYVPVDAAGLALSTLQVVLAPVVLGAWLQSTFPAFVAWVVPFTPLAAVLISSLLACSVFSANVGLLGNISDFTFSSILSSNLNRVAQAVLLLHAGGFFLGYMVCEVPGLEEPQKRAISIEVGMQNSSLGVVLATAHFSSPLVAVPAAVSALLMNVMGSALAVVWRYSGGSTSLQTSIRSNHSDSEPSE